VTRPISQARAVLPHPTGVAEAIAHALTRSAPGLIRAIDPACGEGHGALPRQHGPATRWDRLRD